METREIGEFPARVARCALLALVAAAALLCAQAARADLVDETALADRYAPVVALVDQDEECGPGEPYEPIDVELLFDEPTVALRGPWESSGLVKIAPVAADLVDGRFEYHLDFPGNALEPGCSYERWARRLAEGREPAVYAHVATDPGHPGRLALQYWLYYAFNDWNNTHEGDWEMIQLVFEARDAAEALGREPVEVGYSQHEGAERAEWGDDKLRIEDGTHPVVHPAAGSHANFFGEALHIGSSAEEGVGCDNTLGPSTEYRPVVHTIPGDPEAAKAAYPWIDYEGRWGELQPSIFNGPTGPNLKGQWTEPIAWAENWRDRSYAVPVGGILGTEATDFFCSAVATGSNTLRRAVNEPLPTLLALVGLAALVLYGISRATWHPTAPFRLARRRTWGQIVAASARMYVSRFLLFVGMGLLFLPIAVVISVAQGSVFRLAELMGLEPGGEGNALLVLLVVAIGTSLTLLGVGLVQAATVRALVELDEGRPIDPLRAYRLAFDSVRGVLGAILIAVFVISLLVSSIFLVPVAVWLAIRWSLGVPSVELEGRSAVGALRRSSELVRSGGWLKVASLTVVAGGLALALGPLVGALLILVTDAPLTLLNVVAGLVYVVALPFVALTTAYVYFDRRVRHELAPEPEPKVLPAEIELVT
jgi:hypothetical protein